MAGPSTALLSARRLYDMAALARRVAEGWAPLPHQIPPPGDWYGWLLLAGRGAGKTDACANWMIEHVNGPACMPGPIPHWMAIIGPTLGDAVRSGGNTCAVWCEEMAAWRYLDQAYAQMRFGLRTGPHPRWVGSTTPRPRALIKKFAQKTPRNMVVTHATTRDKPHLTPDC